jgi:hypothetical protein
MLRRQLHTIAIPSATVAAIAAVLAPAAALAAPTAKPLTGTWSGKTSQDISFADDGAEPFSARITFSALNGRLAGVYTTVRMECPGPAVQDIRILKSFAGKGPKLSQGGGFEVKVNGVSISGGLGPAGGSGRFNVARGGCHGKGTWKAMRRL